MAVDRPPRILVHAVGICRFREGQTFCCVVVHRVAEETVDAPQGDRVGHADIPLVGEDNDAELAIELKDNH